MQTRNMSNPKSTHDDTSIVVGGSVLYGDRWGMVLAITGDIALVDLLTEKMDIPLADLEPVISRSMAKRISIQRKT